MTGPVPSARQGDAAPLAEAERALVARVLTPYVGQRGTLPVELGRLLGPADRAMEAFGYRRSSVMRHRVNRVLLRGVERLGTPPQAWSNDDWMEILTLFGGIHRLAATATAVAGYGLRIGRGDRRFYEDLHASKLARRLFGEERFKAEVARVAAVLTAIGYKRAVRERHFDHCLADILLWHESPSLDAVMPESWAACPVGRAARVAHHRIGIALVQLGILPAGGRIRRKVSQPLSAEDHGMSPEWLAMCVRWRETSPAARATRGRHYNAATLAGRWVSKHDTAVRSPADWTADHALAFVAYVAARRVHDDTVGPPRATRFTGHPLASRSKANLLGSLRLFFGDIQERGWVPRRFDAVRAFATPRDILRSARPAPRPIDDGYWLKLRAAALALTPADTNPLRQRKGGQAYPFEMVRALAVAWAFSGCRANEISRLELDCTYTEHVPEQVDPATGKRMPAFEQTMLRVPVNKTAGEFVKPVEAPLGDAVETWRLLRPRQAMLPDPITCRPTHFVFCFRGQRASTGFVNASVIPILLRKAGLPEDDTRGRITSHRGRATLATRLYNPSSGFASLEVMRWLGHTRLESGQHYIELSPVRLMTAFHRSTKLTEELRCVRALVDGRPEPGESVLRYDLGHGWCTNPAYAACAHRMACARCSFYEPAETFAPLLAAQSGRFVEVLQRLDLTEDERAAVEGDAEAVERLRVSLAGQKTPGQ
jgi:integrase